MFVILTKLETRSFWLTASRPIASRKFSSWFASVITIVQNTTIFTDICRMYACKLFNSYRYFSILLLKLLNSSTSARQPARQPAHSPAHPGRAGGDPCPARFPVLRLHARQPARPPVNTGRIASKCRPNRGRSFPHGQAPARPPASSCPSARARRVGSRPQPSKAR